MKSPSSILLFIASFLVCALPSAVSAQWSEADLEKIQPFGGEQRIVGTHYFYWYQYPGEHFATATGHDLLQDHFPDPESVSYLDPDWHAKQLEDCASAGIDFILPVYWGVVGSYFSPGVSFSVQGLGPLRHAMEQRARAGKPAPKIGLFYDTSTLSPHFHGMAEKLDLGEEPGRDIFYRTIRDFFYQIPPRFWAAIDGRPLVVLYGSGFAGAHDQSTFDTACRRFAEDFHGRRPYIIRDVSWQGETAGITKWGAALNGPSIFDHVAQIGPGYNDTAVPGRMTPIRDREEGNFYRWSWHQVLQRDVRIVLLETWNEMHEGTSLCHSREYGRAYIELTRQYSDLFRQGKQPQQTITLQFPKPRPRPPSDRGKEFRGAAQVSATLGQDALEKGLWLVRGVPDGKVANDTIGGESCVATPSSSHGYLYFDVADPFLWEAAVPVTVEYTYWDDGFENVALQYDSNRENTLNEGAYHSTSPVLCSRSKMWKTHTVRLTDARFVNRQNGGADFRLAVQGGRLSVASICVQKQGR